MQGSKPWWDKEDEDEDEFLDRWERQQGGRKSGLEALTGTMLGYGERGCVASPVYDEEGGSDDENEVVEYLRSLRAPRKTQDELYRAAVRQGARRSRRGLRRSRHGLPTQP